MQIINKIMMLAIVVNDMPKAKEFYADKLGMKVAKDYRQDDDHWWVSVAPTSSGTSITLTTLKEDKQPGTITLWLATSDIAAAHKGLSGKGIKLADIKDDLYGPGSGVKWFSVNDPDGNLIHIVEEKTPNW
jgi:catechol 2,3-dioxygenase-like lactoylglutathione lyase family enzyme